MTHPIESKLHRATMSVPISAPTSYQATLRRYGAIVLQWTISFTVLILIWEFVYWAEWIERKVLPAPHQIAAEIQNQPNFLTPTLGMPRRGNHFNLPSTIWVSLQRVVLGLASAFAISLAVGLALSYYHWTRRLFLPIVQMLAPISPIAWIPLAFVFFGVSESAIVFVIFIALFALLVLSTVKSIDNVERVYLNAARVLGANRQQIMLQVILPAILPELFVSLRLNFFAAWMSLLIAEMIGANTGLGQMLLSGRGVFNMRLVLLSMFIIGVCGVLTEALLRLIQDRVLWWRGQIKL